MKNLRRVGARFNITQLAGSVVKRSLFELDLAVRSDRWRSKFQCDAPTCFCDTATCFALLRLVASQEKHSVKNPDYREVSVFAGAEFPAAMRQVFLQPNDE